MSHAPSTRERSPRRRAAPPWLGLLLLLAGACASFDAPPELAGLRPRTRTLQIPFYAQKRHQCGPAALAMALRTSGEAVLPDDLEREVFTPDRSGSLQADMIGAARRHGRIPYAVSGLPDLLQEVAGGRPVVVLQNLGLRWIPVWHYAVAIGYDLERERLILHSGTRSEYAIPLATFERTWARADHWGRAVLAPDDLPSTGSELVVLQAIADTEAAGAWEPASRAYRAAAQRWPQSASAWLGVGNTQYRAGDFAAAEDAFRRATELDAQLGPAWNNLAHVLAARGKPTEARATIERALQLGGPWRDLYLRTLSEIEQR